VAVPAIVNPQLTEQEAQNKLIRETYGRGLTDQEFQLMKADADHRGLDIVTKDVTAIKFGNQAAVIMPTVHGLRKLADRSGLLADTEGPYFCGKDGVWVDVWLDEKAPPTAAKFIVYRSDRQRPIIAIVTWAERAQRTSAGLMPTWKAMPSHMLGKVAETDAYKKARLVPDNREDYSDPQARNKAYGRLHAVAEAQGLSHDQARAVVAQISPGAESLTDDEVQIEDIHDAASLIEALGSDALEADVIDTPFVDESTGEFIAPSPREQWRISCKEAIDASDSQAVKALWIAAGTEDWKWQVLIECGRALAFVNRSRDFAVSAGVRVESADAWVQEWKDAQTIRSENAKKKFKESEQAALIPNYSHLTK